MDTSWRTTPAMSATPDSLAASYATLLTAFHATQASTLMLPNVLRVQQNSVIVSLATLQPVLPVRVGTSWRMEHAVSVIPSSVTVLPANKDRRRVNKV